MYSAPVLLKTYKTSHISYAEFDLCLINEPANAVAFSQAAKGTSRCQQCFEVPMRPPASAFFYNVEVDIIWVFSLEDDLHFCFLSNIYRIYNGFLMIFAKYVTGNWDWVSNPTSQ